MNSSNFTPKTNIDEYLINADNIIIYKAITKAKDRFDQFNPLDFFNLLYKQLNYIIENKTRPTHISSHLMNLDMGVSKSKYPLYILMYYLNELILIKAGRYRWGDPKDKSLMICYNFINEELIKLQTELFPDRKPPIKAPLNSFDFGWVNKRLELLSDKAKIKFLTEAKLNAFEEIVARGQSENPQANIFLEKFELEIFKINTLIQLEQNPSTVGNQSIEERETSLIVKGLPELSLAERYYIAYQLEMLEPLENLSQQKNKHRLLAILLGCSIENAKKLFNGTYNPLLNMTKERKDELKQMIDKLR